MKRRQRWRLGAPRGTGAGGRVSRRGTGAGGRVSRRGPFGSPTLWAVGPGLASRRSAHRAVGSALGDQRGQAATEAVILLAGLMLLGGVASPFLLEWVPRVFDALDQYLAGFRWAWSQPFA